VSIISDPAIQVDDFLLNKDCNIASLWAAHNNGNQEELPEHFAHNVLKALLIKPRFSTEIAKSYNYVMWYCLYNGVQLLIKCILVGISTQQVAELKQMLLYMLTYDRA